MEEKPKEETSKQVISTALLENNKHKAGRRAVVVTCFIQVSCLVYLSTLKMGTICCFETFVDFQRASRRYTAYQKTEVFIMTAVITSDPKFIHNSWSPD
jgi:hypothetical protein